MKRTISKSERPYRLLLCVMISLLVIMLAGCSTSSDSDTNTRGFTDFATIEKVTAATSSMASNLWNNCSILFLS
jgi:uncharacterized lipoprotein